MTRTRFRLAALGAAVAASALTAVSTAQAAPLLTAPPTAKSSQSLKGATLRIGYQTDGLASLLTVSGALKGKAYAIKRATFTSGPPLLESLQANKIDVGGVGNTPPIFAAANRANFRLVAAIKQRRTAADEIVVKPSSSIKGLKGLKGKTIAYTRGSSAHGFLIQALRKAGLKRSQVKLRDLTPGDGLAAFGSGKVDAWATFEPFITLANARILPAGRGYAAPGLSFVVASNNALSSLKKRTAIRDYLVRLRRALAYGVRNQTAWARAFSKESGLPEPLALKAIRKTLVDLRPVRSGLVRSEQTLANVLADAGAVKRVNIRKITSNQIK